MGRNFASEHKGAGAPQHRGAGAPVKNRCARGSTLAPLPPKVATKLALGRQRAVERVGKATAKDRKAARYETLLAERAQLRELRARFEHLAPFDGLRRELLLQAQYWGLGLHELVIIFATADILLGCCVLAFMVASLPIVLGTVGIVGSFMQYFVGFLQTLLKYACYGTFLCTILYYTHLIVRPLWMYIWFYRQRKRLRNMTDTCSVCLEDFASTNIGGMKTLACGHCFHADCIMPWLKETGRCPLCRSH